MNNKVVVAFSGGIDSTVLLYHARSYHKEVVALSFDYNQRHKKELEITKEQTKILGIEHKIIDISFFGSLANSSLTNQKIDVALSKDVIGEAQTSNYVPFRNLMMLSICCAAAESTGSCKVYYGTAQADSAAGYWDGSEDFIQSINKTISLNRKNKIEVYTPLIEMHKQNIIKEGIRLGVDFRNTWTCYQGNELSCGKCPACSLRLQGFILAGYKDPLVYENQTTLEEYYLKNNCRPLYL